MPSKKPAETAGEAPAATAIERPEADPGDGEDPAAAIIALCREALTRCDLLAATEPKWADLARRGLEKVMLWAGRAQG